MLLRLGEHELDCTRRTAVMAILNVSVDSPVSESIVPPEQALERALALRAAGAEIIDVGAHSTRSNAQLLTAQEEIERVCPAVEAISRAGLPTSVDTWNPEVARAAAASGAHLLNDVTAGRHAAMAEVADEFGLPVCAMHMRGQPGRHAEVDQTYRDVRAEVRDFLLERAAALEAAGVPQVWLDPGFAFGKSTTDNVRLLHAIPELVASGRPVLISASRKGFLGELVGEGYDQQAPHILEATLAFNVLAAQLGAHVVRVHDVEAVTAALRVVNAARAEAAEEGERDARVSR